MRKIVEFLENKDKVKISIRFRGREMAHQEIGKAQLDRIIEDTAEIAIVEQAPKVEGRQMGMLLGPAKKNRHTIRHRIDHHSIGVLKLRY